MDGYQNAASYIYSELQDLTWEITFCELLFQEIKDLIDSDFDKDYPANFISHPNPELITFISNLLVERHKLADGWSKVLQREVDSPETNYQEEITSTLDYFKLRKILYMLRQNQYRLVTELDSEESLDILRLHQYLNNFKQEITKRKKIDYL
jgi:DNA primase